MTTYNIEVTQIKIVEELRRLDLITTTEVGGSSIPVKKDLKAVDLAGGAVNLNVFAPASSKASIDNALRQANPHNIYNYYGPPGENNQLAQARAQGGPPEVRWFVNFKDYRFPNKVCDCVC